MGRPERKIGANAASRKRAGKSAMSESSIDRFVVLRDGRTVTVSAEHKKAQQIARHFKRLRPTATIVVQDLITESSEEI
jgi:hypothetical protein